MRTSILCVCVVAASAIPVVAGRAENVSLNLQTGLWEITGSAQLSGPPAIPKEALAAMSPEQRARFEAAMQAAIAQAAQPRTHKTCLTKEKLSRGVIGLDDKVRPSCTRTVLSSTARTLDVKEECQHENATLSARLHVEAVTPEAVKGTFVMTQGTRPGSVTSTFQGKWLGAECGGVQ
jgi:uncharacterized protein DUF3617